jgi:hypothetical protein
MLAGLEWGTVPDWLSAVGTVGALWAGVLLLRKELDERHDAQRRERELQARLVYCWVRDGATQRTIVIQNASTEPIIDCLFYVAGPWARSVIKATGRDKREVSVSDLIGTRAYYEMQIESVVGSVYYIYLADLDRAIPGQTEIPLHLPKWVPQLLQPSFELGNGIAVLFNDANGLRWQRDRWGRVHEVRSSRSSVKSRRWKYRLRFLNAFGLRNRSQEGRQPSDRH